MFTTSVSKHEQVVDLKAYTQQTLALSIKNDTLIIQNVTTTIPIALMVEVNIIIDSFDIWEWELARLEMLKRRELHSTLAV